MGACTAASADVDDDADRPGKSMLLRPLMLTAPAVGRDMGHGQPTAKQALYTQYLAADAKELVNVPSHLFKR